MKLVTEDLLASVCGHDPEGHPHHPDDQNSWLPEAFDIDEDAFLYESEGEYLYSPAVGFSFTFPAELILWTTYGVQCDEGRGQPVPSTSFGRHEESLARTAVWREHHLAMYRLRFVRKA